MARLYANENLPLPVVRALRTLGHDVLTIQETGRANQEVSDSDVLDMATVDQRTVLTINRKDFIRLHRQVSSHAGIIICTADLDFLGQAQRIHTLVEANEPLKDKLIRVNRLP